MNIIDDVKDKCYNKFMMMLLCTQINTTELTVAHVYDTKLQAFLTTHSAARFQGPPERVQI